MQKIPENFHHEKNSRQFFACQILKNPKVIFGTQKIVAQFFK